MANQHNDLIYYLRTNYLNAKNQYFNYINNYKQDFWNDILNKIKQTTLKRNLRTMIRINKHFNKSSIQQYTNQSSSIEQHTNQSTPTQQHTNQSIPTLQHTKQSTPTQQHTNQTLSNQHYKVIKTSDKDSKSSSDKKEKNISKSSAVSENIISDKEITIFTTDIIESAKKHMYSKTDNPWCAFKNAIADVFIGLSYEFNKISEKKITIIQSRKIQIINKLLDLYKDKYPSYKVLFSQQKELSRDLLINIDNHPLIKSFIDSFKSNQIRNSFIPLVNNIINN